MVGTICHQDFNLHPHGNWTPLIAHDYHDHVGTFVLEGTGSQIVTLTWPSVLHNLKSLQDNSESLTVCENGKILLSHRLFRVG